MSFPVGNVCVLVFSHFCHFLIMRICLTRVTTALSIKALTVACLEDPLERGVSALRGVFVFALVDHGITVGDGRVLRIGPSDVEAVCKRLFVGRFVMRLPIGNVLGPVLRQLRILLIVHVWLCRCNRSWGIQA